MKRWLFGMFLAIAAGQDLKKKRVDVWLYLLFGGLALGMLSGELTGDVNLMKEIQRVLPGLLLLGISIVSGGGVGTGDGCFFLVSGLMLSFMENIMLFCGGTLLCGVYSLGYLFWLRMRKPFLPGAGKQMLPFLPFLLPPGIWLLFSGGM